MIALDKKNGPEPRSAIPEVLSETYQQQSLATLSNFDWRLDDSLLPITLVRAYLEPAAIDALVLESQQYPLNQPQVRVFGQLHKVPRTQVWFADNNCNYKYSGLLVKALPWPCALNALKKRLNDEYQLGSNSVLVNCYRQGEDCMGWHSDNEPEIIAGSAIASISLGATRDFLVRHRHTKRVITIPLHQGDLLIMHAPMQIYWQHSVPKRLRVKQSRLNFTLRRVAIGFNKE